MSIMRSLLRRQFRLYDLIRDPRALEVGERFGAADGFGALAGHKYCVLVTFRRSGEPVPTALWFGLADGNLYFRTLADAGKVKRIRHTEGVRIAPSNARGKPLGPLAEGRARVLAPAEEPRAERALQANYGLGRRIYKRLGTSDALRVQPVYVEVSPVRST